MQMTTLHLETTSRAYHTWKSYPLWKKMVNTHYQHQKQRMGVLLAVEDAGMAVENAGTG